MNGDLKFTPTDHQPILTGLDAGTDAAAAGGKTGATDSAVLAADDVLTGAAWVVTGDGAACTLTSFGVGLDV